jgi:hypothetical protein
MKVVSDMSLCLFTAMNTVEYNYNTTVLYRSGHSSNLFSVRKQILDKLMSAALKKPIK